jgi:hypothetical protein
VYSSTIFILQMFGIYRRIEKNQSLRTEEEKINNNLLYRQARRKKRIH